MPPSPPPAPAAPGGSSGGSQTKLWAILGYIIPILFFVPLITDAKNDPFAKYHANQQLNLLLYWIAIQIVLPLIPIIGWILLPVAYIIGLIFLIMGLVNAAGDKQKPLPVIGKFELIK